MSEEIKLRPEVLGFAQEMEKTLRANDAEKGDSWKTMPMYKLHECLNNEADEYWAAETEEDSAKECVDSANILMMLYHRHKGEIVREYAKEGT